MIDEVERPASKCQGPGIKQYPNNCVRAAWELAYGPAFAMQSPSGNTAAIPTVTTSGRRKVARVRPRLDMLYTKGAAWPKKMTRTYRPATFIRAHNPGPTAALARQSGPRPRRQLYHGRRAVPRSVVHTITRGPLRVTTCRTWTGRSRTGRRSVGRLWPRCGDGGARHDIDRTSGQRACALAPLSGWLARAERPVGARRGPDRGRYSARSRGCIVRRLRRQEDRRNTGQEHYRPEVDLIALRQVCELVG